MLREALSRTSTTTIDFSDIDRAQSRKSFEGEIQQFLDIRRRRWRNGATTTKVTVSVLLLKFATLLPLLIMVLFVATLAPPMVLAQFSPCDGKAMLNQDCDLDSDCDVKGSICLRQKCKCHANYMEVVDKNGAHRCIRLPAKIGQECQNKCREPLFCRNGRCQCVQRGSTSIVNGECVWISKVGDRCTRHGDCTAPFSACVNQQCSCITGTVQQGTKCVASTNCPLGGIPSGSCIRQAQPHQIPNFVENADTCSMGYFCVTTLESPLGHCCPILCPLSSTVDNNYTCVPGMGREKPATGPMAPTKPPAISPAAAAVGLVFAREATAQSGLANLTRFFNNIAKNLLPCPSDTHFCHYISGDTFSQAACCKRPCNAMSPYSYYLNGECVARGQLNSECKYHEQCGAGEGMSCKNGFVPSTDQITHPTKNPSQFCVRECEKGKSLSRDTSCLGKTDLLGPCFVQEQCPENSGCWRGRCLCRCGFQKTKNRCTPIPVTTTPRSQTQPVQGLIVPGSPGQVNIINQLWGLFGPQPTGG